jgi:SAM-dependent methyltransferase
MIKQKISSLDIKNLKIIRTNVSRFLKENSKVYDSAERLLDIAPQDYGGARGFFTKAKIYTLDINPKTHPDFVADICKNNLKIIPDDFFKFVVCTEVLGHVLDPFAAVKEIGRILKPGGLLFISTPFNLRIHGPLPDCWRFTEHGLKSLLKIFKILRLNAVETKSRWLMPIHYTVVAQKPRKK